jgi:hypothetical protein
MLLIAGAASAALTSAAAAEPAPAPRAAVAAVDVKAVVAEVRRVLSENYVLGEVRPKLDAALAKGLAAGRYSVSDPAILSERINADLSEVAHDKHLGIQYDPKTAAWLAAQPPEDDDAEAAPTPEEMRQAQLRNHGLAELKVLPGNVRYLDMDGFMWVGRKSAEAYDMAARFLKDGDAVIIDLRRNGGGSPDAVQYLISHFLAPNTPLVTFHMGANKVNRLAALPALPAGRMVGKPLYVLISGRTGSAAEEFAGHVAGYKLGELIGETTAGAGFRNQFFAIPGGYLLSVSVGRAVLASTGGDWEGRGISPTSPVAVDKALQVAQVHALQRLAGTAPAGEKPGIEARVALLAAQITPVATALPLAAYAGTFGDRTVLLEDGRLALQRKGGAKLVMVPIGPNRFALEADAATQVEFSVSGSVASGLELIRSDGSRVTATRTS